MSHKLLFIFTIIFLIALNRTAKAGLVNTAANGQGNALSNGATNSSTNNFNNAVNSPAFAYCASKLGITASTNLYDPLFEQALMNCIKTTEAEGAAK